MFPDPSDWPDHIHAYVYGTPIPGDSTQVPVLDELQSTIYTVQPAPFVREFSVLRSESAHPWRTIHRFAPQKMPTPVPATVVHAIIDEPVPITLLPPILTPLSSTPQPTALPAEMPYGVVQSRLTLACARELPQTAFHDICVATWGPHPDLESQILLSRLPPDQFAFLCTLAEITSLKLVFGIFYVQQLHISQTDGLCIAEQMD
ncbi:hypothetical protein B0H10DRAFT_2210482 [Mycena sp. CBHHK59/15]|nr:hypothetical protein B0H10DRAFT_2210482 [Mycena sp. CBHHK59/15]